MKSCVLKNRYMECENVYGWEKLDDANFIYRSKVDLNYPSEQK